MRRRKERLSKESFELHIALNFHHVDHKMDMREYRRSHPSESLFQFFLHFDNNNLDHHYFN